MKKHWTKRAKKEAAAAYLFILPFLAGVAIFNIYAFIKNFVISFTDKKSFGTPRFIGFENYARLFADQKFYQAIWNTLQYIVICVPAIIILSLLIAMVLNGPGKGNRVIPDLDLSSHHHAAHCGWTGVEMAV